MNQLQGIGIPQDKYSSHEVADMTATTATTIGKSIHAAAGVGEDQTWLSTAGSQISPADGSDVRTDKVAALQAKIAAGTYNVSSSDVAEKIMGALLR